MALIRFAALKLRCTAVRFGASAESMTLQNQAINIDCFQICETEGSCNMKITPLSFFPVMISTALQGLFSDPPESYSSASAEVSPFYLKGISTQG